MKRNIGSNYFIFMIIVGLWCRIRYI